MSKQGVANSDQEAVAKKEKIKTDEARKKKARQQRNKEGLAALSKLELERRVFGIIQREEARKTALQGLKVQTTAEATSRADAVAEEKRLVALEAEGECYGAIQHVQFACSLRKVHDLHG